MNYTEITGDLFKEAKGRVLAHCISADFALGAGIAVKFREMGVKQETDERRQRQIQLGVREDASSNRTPESRERKEEQQFTVKHNYPKR